jgi:hypothetical protein
LNIIIFLDDRLNEDSAPLPDILKWKSNLIIENGILFDMFKCFCSVLSFVDLRFDPSACGPGLFISDNNTHLRQNVASGAHHTCRTMGNGWTQGVHYWSVKIIDRSAEGRIMIGIISSAFNVSLPQYVGQTSDSYGFYPHNGQKYNNGANVVFTSDLPKNGDVIGVLLDLEARTLTYFKNGQILGTAFGQIPLQGNDIKYYPAISCYELGNWVSLIKTTK